MHARLGTRLRAAKEGCWPLRPQRGIQQALLDRAVSCVQTPEAGFVLEESLPVPMAARPEGETVNAVLKVHIFHRNRTRCTDPLQES